MKTDEKLNKNVEKKFRKLNAAKTGKFKGRQAFAQEMEKK